MIVPSFQSVVDFFDTNLIWTEGWYLFLGLTIATAFFWWLYRPVSYLTLTLLALLFYFFRDPVRLCLPAIDDHNLLVCPADGKVVDISYDPTNPEFPQKVSIFLSPLDVHVNRSPMVGTVTQVTYTPGSFVLAFLPKSSLDNEHNDITITDEWGRTIMVRQIAGTVARRIVCWVAPGDRVRVGHKLGMIKFGSRVDTFLPATVVIDIGYGQYVKGGQTIMGHWHNGSPTNFTEHQKTSPS